MDTLIAAIARLVEGWVPDFAVSGVWAALVEEVVAVAGVVVVAEVVVVAVAVEVSVVAVRRAWMASVEAGRSLVQQGSTASPS